VSTGAPLARRESAALLGVHALLASALEVSLVMMTLYLSSLGVHGERQLAAWSGAAYGVGIAVSAVATPLWGALGDRVGRRAMLLRAACGLSVAQALCLLAQEPWHLVAARAVQGAISGVTPALYAFAAVRAGEARVGRTLGLLESVGSGASMVGPLAASALVAAGGFRLAYGASSAAAALAALAVLLLLREAPRGARPVKEATREPGLDGPAPREKDPLEGASAWARLRAVARSRTVRGVLLAAVLVEVAHSAIELLYPILIVRLTPDEGLRASLAATVNAVGEGLALLSAPLLGRAADRWGDARVMRGCMAVTGLATLAAPLARAGLWLLPVVAVADGAAAGVQPGVYARLSRASPPGLTGTAVALGGSALRLGGVAGVALAAPLVALVGLPGAFWLAGGWLVVLAGWAPWQPRTPHLAAGRGPP
jgi:DHA1 family multidrug resistance protein-like MFS transporter